jgi:hypothetical protein
LRQLLILSLPSAILNEFKLLDSGPFDKPFENLRVPSLSRDFRRNDGKRGFPTLCEFINVCGRPSKKWDAAKKKRCR